MQQLTFTVPGVAPQSTSPNGRAHYLRRHAEGKRYGETVFLLAQAAKPLRNGSLPFLRASVTLTQRAVRLRDHDNFAASFKPGLDALTRAGIIEDDKPQVIDLILRAEQMRTRAEECVVVCVVPL